VHIDITTQTYNYDECAVFILKIFAIRQDYLNIYTINRKLPIDNYIVMCYTIYNDRGAFCKE
jgi:hypothetical protein